MLRRLSLGALLCLATMTLAQAHVPDTTTFPLLPDPVIRVEPLTPIVPLAAKGLSPLVAQRALAALSCASAPGQTIDKLIVVDMNMSSRRKRLWAFDLKGGPKLILNARVAHGSGSDPDGDGIANRFSNIEGSNMTSLGLYRIAEAYEGKNGLSRRLDGLLDRFNSRARERAVVMHPSNYVRPGHVGRSQGCPAVSQDTMDALEKAGLSNAVLWIDGPDRELDTTVVECAQRKRQLAMAMLMTEAVIEDPWLQASTVSTWRLAQLTNELAAVAWWDGTQTFIPSSPKPIAARQGAAAAA